MPLDTLVTGRIATFAGDSGFGWVEAIGIRDGKVAFAGSAVDLESRADPHTRRIELEPGERRREERDALHARSVARHVVAAPTRACASESRGDSGSPRAFVGRLTFRTLRERWAPI